MPNEMTLDGSTSITITAGNGIVVNDISANNGIELNDPYLNTIPSLLLALTRTLIKSGAIDRGDFLNELKQATIDIAYAPDDYKDKQLSEKEMISFTTALMSKTEKIMYGLENENKKVLHE